MRIISPIEVAGWLTALWQHSRNLRTSRAAIERAQLRKFRRLVNRAWNRSPYYRSIIESYGIDRRRCVPSDFPVLTKNEVIERFDDIVTDRRISRARVAEFLASSKEPDELLDGRYHVLHTSGTSGTVGYFVFSHGAWIKGASHITRVSPPRVRTRCAFVAATRGHFAGASLVLTGNHGTNRWFYDVRTFDVGQPMPQIIDELNKFQPHTLSGYAAVLKVLAEAKERGELRITPRQLGNGGEPLLPCVKSYLESVFQAPVVNVYASSEHLYMGMTLPGSDGMYLLEDDLIFELHDDHTCVTNLFNHVMPLIRYRMDDVLVPDAVGPRRYPFTKISEVVGRYEEAIIFKNRFGVDDFIHPIVIVEFFVPGLNGWQLLLLDKESFVFRARYDQNLNESDKHGVREQIHNRLQSILAEKSMDNVRFRIDEVQELPIDPYSAKFRLVLRQ